MKICYISNYKEASGYSAAARNYIEAIASVGIDIVPQNVRITGTSCEVSNKIKELEKNNLDQVGVVIQHTLPHMFERKEGVFNILMFAVESDRIPEEWIPGCRAADLIVMFSEHSKDCLKRQLKTENVVYIPHTFDPAKYAQEYSKLLLNPVVDGRFKFYSIGETNLRKNTVGLLRAYLTEFRATDNAILILKTSIQGQDQETAANTIKTTIEEIKRGTKLKTFAPVLIITERFPEDTICRLHATCDCYVTLSRGEAWNIGAFEAKAFGNHVVCSDIPGHRYLKNTSSIFVTTYLSKCFGNVDTFDFLHTAEEIWHEPCIYDASSSMRNVYEYFSDKTDLKNSDFIKQFSYEEVGNLFKETIEERINAVSNK